MNRFSRKVQSHAPRIRTSFGTFEFNGESWMTKLVDGGTILSSIGNEIDVGAIIRAALLLRDVSSYVDTAIAFAKDHGFGDFWEDDETPSLELIEISEILNEKFGLTFGKDDNSDFTVTVEFSKGKPCEVWGAD